MDIPNTQVTIQPCITSTNQRIAKNAMVSCENKNVQIGLEQISSPHEAIIGNSGCLAIDLMLPEHFPRKQPSSFPVKRGFLQSDFIC